MEPPFSSGLKRPCWHFRMDIGMDLGFLSTEWYWGPVLPGKAWLFDSRHLCWSLQSNNTNFLLLGFLQSYTRSCLCSPHRDPFLSHPISVLVVFSRLPPPLVAWPLFFCITSEGFPETSTWSSQITLFMCLCTHFLVSSRKVPDRSYDLWSFCCFGTTWMGIHCCGSHLLFQPDDPGWGRGVFFCL